MGIAIGVKVDPVAIAGFPQPTYLELTCDGEHGFFAPPPISIPGDSFIEQHKAAMAMGWKETFNAQGQRIWLCPDCSGKAASE